MPRLGRKRTTRPADERELSVYGSTTFLGSTRGTAGKYVARDARRRRLENPTPRPIEDPGLDIPSFLLRDHPDCKIGRPS
jgi:hypothetical protein